MENGQNLNFAVPVVYLRALIENRNTIQKAAVVDTASSLAEAKRLQSLRDNLQYSDDPNSDYQKYGLQIQKGMVAVVRESNAEGALTEVACLGTKAYEFSDTGIAAARKLNKLQPSPAHKALLSYVLLDRGRDEDVTSFSPTRTVPVKLRQKLPPRNITRMQH